MLHRELLVEAIDRFLGAGSLEDHGIVLPDGNGVLAVGASAFTTYAPVTLPETLTLPDADSSPVCAATNASYWVLALSADDHCAATSVTSLAASPVE